MYDAFVADTLRDPSAPPSAVDIAVANFDAAYTLSARATPASQFSGGRVDHTVMICGVFVEIFKVYRWCGNARMNRVSDES